MVMVRFPVPRPWVFVAFSFLSRGLSRRRKGVQPTAYSLHGNNEECDHKDGILEWPVDLHHLKVSNSKVSHQKIPFIIDEGPSYSNLKIKTFQLDMDANYNRSGHTSVKSSSYMIRRTLELEEEKQNTSIRKGTSICWNTSYGSTYLHRCFWADLGCKAAPDSKTFASRTDESTPMHFEIYTAKGYRRPALLDKHADKTPTAYRCRGQAGP